MEEEEEPRRANRESFKEDEGPSKKHKRVKRPRRKITIEDFPLGKGRESYDLIEDLGNQRPNITYPQLLELSPSLRKQWSKIASTRKSKRGMGKPVSLVKADGRGPSIGCMD